jgi:hypothetical protein
MLENVVDSIEVLTENVKEMQEERRKQLRLEAENAPTNQPSIPRGDELERLRTATLSARERASELHAQIRSAKEELSPLVKERTDRQIVIEELRFADAAFERFSTGTQTIMSAGFGVGAGGREFDERLPMLVREWRTALIVSGRELGGYLDGRVMEVIGLPFGVDKQAWNPFGWQPLKVPITAVLSDLPLYRDDVRAYEVDVAQYLENASAVGLGAEVLPVTQMLNALEQTYKRGFDLCVLKLNIASAGQVSATNIMIAVLALVVATFSLHFSISGPSGTAGATGVGTPETARDPAGPLRGLEPPPPSRPVPP